MTPLRSQKKYKDHREHVRTIRQQMIDLLSKEAMNARELSRVMGIREKEVYDHLYHVARSAASHRKKLIIGPFRCLACGYLFQNRKRFTRPGRCPRCKRSHIEEPTYRIS